MADNIQNIIMQIKKRNLHKKMYTNFYFSKSIEEYTLFEGEQSIVIQCKDCTGVCRVYFVSYNLHELGEQLAAMPSGSALNHLGELEPELLNAITQAGFYQATRFLRLSNANFDHIFEQEFNPFGEYIRRYGEDKSVQLAQISDAEALFDKMKSVWDPRLSHLPSIEKLINLIQTGQAYVYKQDNEILSFFISEITGKKFYTMHSYNSAEKHILLSMYVKAARNAVKQGCTYAYSWVEETNQASMRYNQLKQSFPDGFTDTIFFKEET